MIGKQTINIAVQNKNNEKLNKLQFKLIQILNLHDKNKIELFK